MAIFEDFELEWNRVTYRISGDDHIMRTLAAVEDHVTFMELEQGRVDGKLPIAKLSMAYATVLQRAGCQVSSAEVYNGMWGDGKTASKVAEAIGGLLRMMIPESAFSAVEKQEASKQPAKKPEGGKPSKRPTKRQS